jgi:hypothetical protein
MILYEKYRCWRTDGLKDEDGILIGSDQTQEWLLAWWWENYRRHNYYPVAFVDFGLSEEKKKWCKARGELVSLRVADIFVKEREEIDSHLVASWEDYYGEQFWVSRRAWFKKPLACLQSPFKRTLWVDLDCEIVGSLGPLFETCQHPSGIALAKDQIAPTYNSGVIAFRRNLDLLKEWADQSFQKTDTFRGDQDLLSALILQKKMLINELPPIYNWSVGFGKNKQAVIYHWLGDRAKAFLRQALNLKHANRLFPFDQE